jgi:hypothetical protein
VSLLYKLTAVWPLVADTPANIGQKFLRTLDALSTLEEWLNDWVTDDGKTFYPIDKLRNSMTEWVASRVFIDDLGEEDESNGYSVFALSNFHQAWPVGCTTSFHVNAGSTTELSDFAQFEVGARPPRTTDLAFITFDLYKAVLLTIIGIWPSYWANASCWIWGQDPPTQPGEPPLPHHSGFQIPWISYLSPEAAAGFAPPAGIETERTPDGGFLMIATRERFDPYNAEHMRASRIILEIMIARRGGLGR